MCTTIARLAGIAALFLALSPLNSFADKPNLVVDTLALKQLLTSQHPDACRQYWFNASRHLPRLYREQKLDSIALIQTFIAEKCGVGPFHVFNALQSIRQGASPENRCDSLILNKVLHRSYGCFTFEWLNPSADTWFSRVGQFAPLDTSYYQFIRELAEDTRASAAPGSDEYLLATYYAGHDSLIRRSLRQGEYAGTCYQDRYVALRDSLLWERNAHRVHIAAITGIWIPRGAADILGPKMELGFLGGYRWRRFGFDIPLVLRIIDGRRAYQIKKADAFADTKTYIGVYLGIEPNVLMFRFGRWETELFGGIGYDGFSPRAPSEDEWDSINSLNLSVGLTQRVFVNRDATRHISLQARYSVLDYNSHGGSNLSGDAISINILYGWLSNSSPNWDLTAMEYWAK